MNDTMEELNRSSHNTLMQQLGIEYLEKREGYVKARMPVDERTKQPMGILHGGASLALAETIGSLGSALLLDLDKYDVRGANINANHVGAVTEGWVYGEAELIHRGRYTHVWNINIRDEHGRLISVSRLTNMIIEK